MTAPAASAPRAAPQPNVPAAGRGNSPARRPPWRALAGAAAAALALHALLLGAMLDGAPAPAAAESWRAGPGAPMSARQIARPPPQPAPPAPPAAPAAPAAEPAPPRTGAPAGVVSGATAANSRRQAAVDNGRETAAAADGPAAEAAAAPSSPDRVGAEPAAAPASEASPAATAAATAVATPAATAATTPAATPAAPSTERAASAAADATTAQAADGSTPGVVPVYRTQPAPPATLLFELKRGLAGGQAVLQWRPDSGNSRYGLTLQAQAFGISVAGWNSSGRFDGAGLAPDRYAESRRGREVRATNFQRATQKISFSAQSAEYELTPGVQDRSSWMLQLGAVLQANPELARPGAQVTLMVAGTRGAPEPWLFTVVDRMGLTLAGGELPLMVADAVQLLREPRRPYDTRVRVWLDPARHHLPVKVQMLVHATGEGQEFELRQLSLP